MINYLCISDELMYIIVLHVNIFHIYNMQLINQQKCYMWERNIEGKVNSL